MLLSTPPSLCPPVSTHHKVVYLISPSGHGNRDSPPPSTTPSPSSAFWLHSPYFPEPRSRMSGDTWGPLVVTSAAWRCLALHARAPPPPPTPPPFWDPFGPFFVLPDDYASKSTRIDLPCYQWRTPSLFYPSNLSTLPCSLPLLQTTPLHPWLHHVQVLLALS